MLPWTYDSKETSLRTTLKKKSEHYTQTQPKHMVLELKRTVSMRGFFCPPTPPPQKKKKKDMLKLMDKKIFQILHSEVYVYLDPWNIQLEICSPISLNMFWMNINTTVNVLKFENTSQAALKSGLLLLSGLLFTKCLST